jgi:ribonuclease HII
VTDVPLVLICGVDEAGRGPLAGPVFAACVILDPARPIRGLADSKQLAPERREVLALRIRERALAFGIASASVAEIDRLNILQATMLAMRRAVEALSLAPGEVVVDGNRCPPLAFPTRAVIRGDAKVRVISAASILAKTARDAHMVELHALRPEYGFHQHKGYGTPEHLDALRRFGACEFHRRTFAPVRDVIQMPLF